MANKVSRRSFLQTSTAASVGVAGYWSSVSPSQAASTSPNERIVWGGLGVGDRWASLKEKRWMAGVGGAAARHGEYAVVCDADSERMERAKKLSGGQADMEIDYRKVLDRDDIDAVTIVTPDHWHTKMSIEAMLAGKDVYCEKPLTLTVDEGKEICRVAEETGRVFQVGTQQRSEMGQMFLKAVAITQSGRLGKINKVTCAIGGGPACDPLPVVDVPQGLDWDRWLGPAPLAAYRSASSGIEGRVPRSRCHYEFRWWYEYSGGKMTDWGAHHIDIAQWALQLDNAGPKKIEPLSVKFPVPFEDGYPTRDDQYNTPTEFKVRCEFEGPDGNEIEMLIQNNARDRGFWNGIMIEGDKGRIFVNREKLTGKAVEELEADPLPEDALTKLCKGKQPGSHMGNFVECIKTRETPISDVWTHHRSMTTCHLANIALRLDRTLEWDPETEQILGDDQASEFLSRAPRKGYETQL